jgi:hypothetical protein
LLFAEPGKTSGTLVLHSNPWKTPLAFGRSRATKAAFKGTTMSAFETISFKMEDRIDGVEITPETIGFASFNRFNKEVEAFIKGGEREIQLDEVHVAVEKGSYRLKLVLPLALAQLIQPDVQRMESGMDLDGMIAARQTIVKSWQRQARKHPEFKISIESAENRFRPVTISSKTDYHEKSENQWVETERYLIGRVQDMGGKSSANVHLEVPGLPKLIKLDSSEEYLRAQKDNMLYHDVQVRILAEQNIRTRELRNVRLIEFAGKPPAYNEDELNQAIKKGTQAWADVENITEWVAEQRGTYEA